MPAFAAIQRGDVIVWKRPPLEHQHAARRILAVAKLSKQLLLHARLCAKRPRSHREETLGIDRPTGVLRRHARVGRMIGPDLDAGPRFTINRERRQRDVTEAAHAELGQDAARSEAARHVDTGVDDARTAREGGRRDPQLARARGAPIGELPGPLVHAEVGHGT